MSKGHKSMRERTSVLDKVTPLSWEFKRAVMGGNVAAINLDWASSPVVESSKARQRPWCMVLLAVGASEMMSISGCGSGRAEEGGSLSASRAE